MQKDLEDDTWLLIIEDEGPDRLGRVLGFLAFDTQYEAEHMPHGQAYDACGIDKSDGTDIEVMTYGDFKESYGKRMPLRNRGNLTA